jgi:hypothetical protein
MSFYEAIITESLETKSTNKPCVPSMDNKNSLKMRICLEIANLKEATEVIVKNHYLHRGRTMAQIAYWISLDNRRRGVVLY